MFVVRQSLNLLLPSILLVANEFVVLHETKYFLSKNFKIKDIGEASYGIGIEIFIDRSQGLLGLSQRAYVERILDKFDMDRCSPEIFLVQIEISLISCNAQRMM